MDACHYKAITDYYHDHLTNTALEASTYEGVLDLKDEYELAPSRRRFPRLEPMKRSTFWLVWEVFADFAPKSLGTFSHESI